MSSNRLEDDLVGQSSREPCLRAEGLTKWFGATRAIESVDLSVAAGQVVALTGPSGSGKSTMLLCLAGILTPDKGQVWINGRCVSSASEDDRSRLRRSEVGVLFQFGQLIAELTAVENVALPLLLGGERRKAATKVAREWLDRFGVGPLADKRPTQMSGGQAQRCALARATVMGPDVLFADEPTGALDQENGRRVLDELSRLADERSTAIVLVTHDPSVAAFAHREVRLLDGRVTGISERPRTRMRERT